MRIAFLQCELEHGHQSPHLAMALMAADAERAGHHVECGLVHPKGLSRCVADLRGRIEFAVIDSIFPLVLAEALRGGLAVPVLVGGHNAMQHMLRGTADFAVVGPGRETLRRWIQLRPKMGEVADLPGAVVRTAEGLDAGLPPLAFVAERELEPFEPKLGWRHWGPPRAPGSDLRLPSIVADSGCPWERSALGEGGPFAGVQPRTPKVHCTPRARVVLDALVGREGGCTFCTFRQIGPMREAGEARIHRLRQQARHWVERGARGLSVQSEHPLPWIGALLRHFAEDGIAARLDEVHIRTIPFLLVRHAEALEAAIHVARDVGTRLVLAQVGFESFDDEGLALFHKGATAEEHRVAAGLLTRLTADAGGVFEGRHGHGLIPLHPYSTAKGLRLNLERCRADAPFLLPSLHPGGRLSLYHEWGPLFWKLEDDGLLEPGSGAFGWGWRFADPVMDEVVARWTASLRIGQAPHVALDAALSSLGV